MAFKKSFRFEDLDPNYRPEPESPYAMTDRFHFRDKTRAPRNIHRGTVEILLDQRAHSRSADAMLGDVAYRATVDKDGKTQKITLVFKGQRADDLKKGRLMADFEECHQDRCSAGDFETEITRTLIVEGAWVPRNWKDHSGVWHKEWEMLVAQWHYSPDGEGTIVVEGALPDFDKH